MKKTVLMLLMVFFGLVSAVEINAPKEIPANINWSYSIELDPTNSFTKTEIYFDGLLIVTAYNDKQPIIQENFVLKAFVFDKKPEDNTGLTVFISYFGIEEGIHKIKSKTFNQGNLTEEKEFELKAIDTITAISELPETFKTDVDILMKEMVNKINEYKIKLEELKNSTEQNLQEKTRALEQKIKAMEETLKELNKIKEIETQNKTQLSEQENGIIVSQENSHKEKNSNPIDGFYNFSVDTAWMGVIFLIILLVMLASFQVYKIKSNQTVFEEELEDRDLEEELGKESSLSAIHESESEKTEEKKSKRFRIGDLIRK